MLTDANPQEGELAYLNLIAEKAPPDVLERIRKSIPLPPGARGVIIDSGRMVRVLVTGTPVGERMLEINFNRGEPSFDAWVRGDWKEERVFRSISDLHKRAAGLVHRYLSPEAVAKIELFV